MWVPVADGFEFCEDEVLGCGVVAVIENVSWGLLGFLILCMISVVNGDYRRVSQLSHCESFCPVSLHSPDWSLLILTE